MGVADHGLNRDTGAARDLLQGHLVCRQLPERPNGRVENALARRRCRLRTRVHPVGPPRRAYSPELKPDWLEDRARQQEDETGQGREYPQEVERSPAIA